MNHYDFAVDLARRAGAILKISYEGNVEVSHKGTDERNLVTNTDIEISDFLEHEISENFADHHIYSEEGEESKKNMTSPWEWVLDPIDGTSNFSRSIPHFAVCIGLLYGGVPVVGVVYNPITDELFSFEKDKGVFLNQTPIKASSITLPKDAFALFRIGRKESSWNWGLATERDFLREVKKISNFGSSGLDLCFLSAGRVDIVVYGTLSTRDIAGAIGILRASGGEIYTVHGIPAEITTKSQLVVATATRELFENIRPFLHPELLTI